MLLKAPWILPVNVPPIKNGAIRVRGDIIEEVGGAQEIIRRPEEKVVELPETILLPGLINAHAHLEFFQLSPSPSSPPIKGGDNLLQNIPSPLAGEGKGEGGKSFTQWVRTMITLQGKSSQNELTARAKKSAQALLESGVTTAALHLSSDLPPDCLHAIAFRTVTFVEVIGPTEERARAGFAKAMNWKIESLIGQEGEIYLTPHSFYSVHPHATEKILETAEGLVSIHLLESEEEDQFFRNRSGPLAELVTERDGSLLFPRTSPIQWLAAHHRLTKNLLIVHGNTLTPEEIRLLQKGESSVIHCPGSHRYFGHRRFPLEELKEAGVTVALGTDSLASNEKLSMLWEMKLLREKTKMPDDEILKMATLNGAKALLREKESGSLEPGKKADIIGLPLRSTDPFKALFETEKVSFMMINGKTLCTTH
ncbi:MAG: amidohydrolase family protein [Deltaproteobacteria bacterium]|nr:amidohydrolase family protein [Deltaproteobacteria bacterium]